jgi:hypothetical protein
MVDMTELSRQSQADVRLRNRWLLCARIAWLAMTLLTVGLYITSLAPYYDFVRLACTSHSCGDAQVTAAQAADLAALDISLDRYAAYVLVFNMFSVAIFLAIALLIFAYKPGSGHALFVALMFVTFGAAGYLDQFSVLAFKHPIWWLPIQTVRFTADLSVMIFMYIFPSGQFVPRWTYGLAILWGLTEMPNYFVPHSSLNWRTWTALPAELIHLTWLSTGLLAQVYRYWRISNLHQRRQT